jgi:hypothetical protein
LCAFTLPVSVAQAWTWPVDGPVLRPFSFDRAHPYAGGQHRGIDIGAAPGTPVVAPTDGVVSFAGTVPGGGKTVSIQVPSGFTATLVHLGSFGVLRGAVVQEGTVVGTVGPSGELQGDEPYVYFGVRVTGDAQGYVDPLSLLPARVVAAPVPQAAADTSLPVAESPVAVAPTAQPESPPEIPSVVTAVAEPAQQNVSTEAISPTHEEAPPAVAEAPVTEAATASEPPQPRIHAVEPASVHAELPPASVAEVERATSLLPVNRSSEVLHEEETAAPHMTAASPMLIAGHTWARRGLGVPLMPLDRPSGAAKPLAAPLQGTAAHSNRGLFFALALVTLTLAAGLALGWRRRRGLQEAARIMSCPDSEQARAAAKDSTYEEEHPRGAGLAVCSREEASGPRGRLRSAGRHLRAVPQTEGQRRADGERDRRARNAGDGDRGPRRRLAA